MHDGELPISLAPLLELCQVKYESFPHPLEAITVRKSSWRYVGMRFNDQLREPSESARQRYTQAHELAHVLLRHRGDFWVMWQAPAGPVAFEALLEGIQERQCDLVAGYLLVPLYVLRDMRGANTVEVAARCDVPPAVVELRWSIWRKHGR